MGVVVEGRVSLNNIIFIITVIVEFLCGWNRRYLKHKKDPKVF